MQKPSAPLVETVDCRAESADYFVTGQGFLAPSESLRVVSEVAGTVEYVSPNLFPGGLLEKDEVVFRIEQQTYAAQRARSEARIASARAALIQSRATLERQSYLENIGATAQSAKEAAEASVAAAEARLADAKAQFELFSEQLRDTEVRAPFRARVTAEDVTLGMFIQPGVPVAEMFAVESGELVLGLSLDDAQAVQRWMADSSGSHTVRVYRLGDAEPLPSDGRIASVDPLLDPATRTVNFRISLRDIFEDKDSIPPALLNEYLEAELPAKAKSNLFSAPRGVVRRERHVFVVGESGVLEKVDVTPVMRRADRVFFTAEAALGGKSLLLTTLAEEQDGIAVRVSRSNSQDDAEGQGNSGSDAP